MAPVQISAAVIAVLVGFPTSAYTQALPSINLDETCKAASGVMLSLMGGSSTTNDLQICKDSENKAREQIIKDWGTYSASDRSGCIQTRVYLPSYIEWLTCFEMNKVVREARQQRGQQIAPLTDPRGFMTLPPVRSLGIMAY